MPHTEKGMIQYIYGSTRGSSLSEVPGRYAMGRVKTNNKT
jgi:hypothetical protein